MDVEIIFIALISIKFISRRKRYVLNTLFSCVSKDIHYKGKGCIQKWTAKYSNFKVNSQTVEKPPQG